MHFLNSICEIVNALPDVHIVHAFIFSCIYVARMCLCGCIYAHGCTWIRVLVCAACVFVWVCACVGASARVCLCVYVCVCKSEVILGLPLLLEIISLTRLAG